MSDFADIADTARAWVRWIWLPVVLGAAAYFAAATLVDSTSVAPRATATLGLTDEVVWPFYDTALARQAGHLDDGEIVGSAVSAAGLSAGDVIVTLSDPDESLSTLAVEVEADTGANAAMIANGVADAVAERDLTRLTTERTAAVESLTTAASGDEQFDGELARAEVELADNRAEIAVIDRAESAAGEASGGSVPVVAGLVAALAGLLVGPALERRFGAVRSTAHVELADADLRWIDTASDDSVLPISQTGDAIAAPFVGSSAPLAVASVDDPADAETVASALAARVGREVSAAGPLSEAGATERCVLAHHVVVTARVGSSKRRTLRRTIDRLRELGVDIEGVVLLPKGGVGASRATS